jgi:hypothetical protein
MYINGVTQRQASEKIRKLRLSATASSRLAAVDDLIERLSTFSVSYPPEDETDEAMTNTLVHCVHQSALGPLATTGPNCKDSFGLRGRMQHAFRSRDR